MTPEDFEVHVNETLAKCKELLLKKNSEYAGGEDRLGGFKRPAAEQGVTPLQVAGIFSGKHYDAIKTFIRESAAGVERERTEPIEGRLYDLINYCVFISALLKDQKKLSPELQRAVDTLAKTGYQKTIPTFKPPFDPIACHAHKKGEVCNSMCHIPANASMHLYIVS